MKKTIITIITMSVFLIGYSGEAGNNSRSIKPIVINLKKCEVNQFSFNYIAGQRPIYTELENKRSKIVKSLNKSLKTTYSNIYELANDYQVFFNGYGISISDFNNSFDKDKVIFIPTITKNTNIQELKKSLGNPSHIEKDNELTNNLAPNKFNSIEYSFDICGGKAKIEFLYDLSNSKLDLVSIKSKQY